MLIRSCLLSLKTVSHCLGIDDFPETKGECPVRALINLRRVIARDQAESHALDTLGETLPVDENDYVFLALSQLESLVSVVRPLTSEEKLTASASIGYIGRLLVLRSLMTAEASYELSHI